MPYFPKLCFPFPKFQVGRVVFDSTNYYIFILDTFAVQNRVSVFERPLCLYFTEKNPEIALCNRKLRSFIVIT